MEQNGLSRNGLAKRSLSSTQPRDLSAMDGFFYYGGNYLGGTLDLIPKGAPFVVKETFKGPCYGFSNKSTAKNWGDLMDFSYSPYPVVDESGNIGFIVTTASNKFYVPAEDMAKYGAIYNPRDENIGRMDGWVGATEGNHAIEHVKIPKFGGLVVSRHEYQPDPKMRLFVTDISYEGHLNNLGKYLSKVETLRQDWNNYFQSKEGKALAREKSGDDAAIQYLGITSLEGVLYAIGRLPNGKIILLSGDKTYDGLSAEAASAKVRLEDRRIAAFGEEAMHHYRKSYDVSKNLEQFIAEETETKAGLLGFYQKLAAGAESKPQLRATYSKIVSLIKRDIATVRERYTASWKRIYGSKEASGLELVLMAEAYANGLETDGEVRDYIASRIKEGNEGDANHGKNPGKGKSGNNGINGKNSDSGEKIAYASEIESQDSENIITDSEKVESGGNDSALENSGETSE